MIRSPERVVQVRTALAVFAAGLGAATAYYALWLSFSLPWRFPKPGDESALPLIEASFWLWSVGVVIFLTGLLLQPPGPSRVVVRTLYLLFALAATVLQLIDGFAFHDRLLWWD